ncbi:MAG: cytochrome c biogenesis protein ResB [Thermacetogeniaceae bacterium]
MAFRKHDVNSCTGMGWGTFLWRLLTSVRIALLLFSILAVVCLPGIFIPQGEDPSFYYHNYGDLVGSLITALDFDQVFTSTWFLVLCLLLFINLLACTIKRWQNFYRLIIKKPSITAVLHFLGSPLIHTGLLLVLLGAFIGAFYSFEHYCEIAVPGSLGITIGEQRYELQAVSFDIEHHPDGSPSQYYTDLKLAKDGRNLYEKTISVNNPLSYQGFKVYQFNYGWLLALSLEKDGSSRNFHVKDGDQLALNEEGSEILQLRFYPDWARDAKGRPISRTPQANNPQLAFLRTSGGLPVDIGMLKPQDSAELGDGLKITFSGYRNYTGLHVKKDPGVPIVFTGFVFLGCGIPMYYLLSKRGRKGE